MTSKLLTALKNTVRQAEEIRPEMAGLEFMQQAKALIQQCEALACKNNRLDSYLDADVSNSKSE